MIEIQVGNPLKTVILPYFDFYRYRNLESTLFISGIDQSLLFRIRPFLQDDRDLVNHRPQRRPRGGLRLCDYDWLRPFIDMLRSLDSR
jgi:hypothetical protein